MMTSLELVLSGAACCLFGGFFFLFLARRWRRGGESRSWLSVRGRVLESTVVVSEGGYTPHVRYAYDIQGASYESARIGLAISTYPFRGMAARIAGRFSPGHDVEVFVDPAHHARAVLSPGSGSVLALLLAGVSLGVAAFGLFLILRGLPG